MKPKYALTLGVSADLSACAFEEALIQLGCFPICTLRVSESDALIAQRVVAYGIPDDMEQAVTSPSVHIIVDPSYKANEWSVEYNGRVLWCQGP
jgi:hypothetical protein